MAAGGFLIKFDGKEVERCYAVAFDYDEWAYIMGKRKRNYQQLNLLLLKWNKGQAKNGLTACRKNYAILATTEMCLPNGCVSIYRILAKNS